MNKILISFCMHPKRESEERMCTVNVQEFGTARKCSDLSLHYHAT
jgi:hypothetical protein